MSGPTDKFGRPIVAGCFLVGAWRRSSNCGLHLWRVVDVDSDGRVWVVRRADYGDGVTKRSRLWSLDNVAVFDNPPASEVAALAPDPPEMASMTPHATAVARRNIPHYLARARQARVDALAALAEAEREIVAFEATARRLGLDVTGA